MGDLRILDQIYKGKAKGATYNKPNAAELKRLMDQEELGYKPVTTLDPNNFA